MTLKKPFKNKLKKSLITLLFPILIVAGAKKLNAINIPEVSLETNNKLIEASVGSGWFSKYIGADGSTFVDSPVVQSYMNIQTNFIGFKAWNNYDLKKDISTERNLEINRDIIRKYLKFSIYASNVTFPNTDIEDGYYVKGELVSRNLPLELTASQTISHFDGYHKNKWGLGLYLLRISKNFKDFLINNLNIDIGGDISYNNNFFVPEEESRKDFSHFTADANIEYDFNEFVLDGGVRYQIPFKGDFDDKIKQDAVYSLGLKWMLN